MTTPDERKRAVDRLLAAPIGTNALSYDFLLSERAELLATVERMRGALDFYAVEHEFPSDGPWGVNSDDFGAVARAALTTGEGTSHD